MRYKIIIIVGALIVICAAAAGRAVSLYHAFPVQMATYVPIVGAVTPMAGGVVFFGDVGGNFYALDAANGQKLWGQSSAARSPAV
jgi:hypothetical protein